MPGTSLNGKKKMSKEEFRLKYEKTNTRKLYNRAIREECPGGSDLLDLLELVSSMRGRASNPEEMSKLTTIEDRLQIIRERMMIDVRNRWGLLDF